MDDFQTKIDEIREKADIVDIIGKYVKLEKQGTGYIGLCPFHEDKNPSMSVSQQKQIFKCFSCNTSGNVIGFIEKYKKIPFIEAMREVADSVGIILQTTKKELINQKNQKYYKITEDSTSFYQFYLKNTKEGQVALEYLHKRNLNTNIINRFRIGLSGSDPDDLYKTLIEKKHLALDILDLGLVRMNENYYDTFRKRIMFPITDPEGHIVGFSGRKYLLDSNDAKYVNSNESVIFKKSQILYNFYEAFQDIKQQNQVYLFEGFMDVIAAYRANILNAVASMGTALTIEQIRIIKRLTNKVVICYDADRAGIEATKRAITMLVNQQTNVFVVSMPEGLDPDDYINKYGDTALKKYLTEQTVNAIEFLYQQEKKQLVVNDITSVENFKKEMFKNITFFNSNVIIETYIKKMSDDISISLDALKDDFRKTNAYIPKEPIKFIPPLQKNDRTTTLITTKFDEIQKTLINYALQNPNEWLRTENRFNNLYVNNDNRDIILVINQYYNNHQSIDQEMIKTKLSSNLVEIFENILTLEVPKNVEEVEYLFNIFSRYPAKKILMKLKEKENKTSEDVQKIIECQKILVDVINNYDKRSDSNEFK